jgi:hypothetical protein
MENYIAVGSRVQIQTLEGLFTGTVLGMRDAYLSEINPPQLANALESNVKAIIMQDPKYVPVFKPDMMTIIRLYEVQLDDATGYRGSIHDGNIATNIYKFITLIEQNDTTVQP